VEAGRLEDAAVLVGHLQAHGRFHSMLARRTSRTAAALGESREPSRRRGASMDRDELVRFTVERLRAGSGRSAGRADAP
jgi:hypothetical protein